MKPETLETLLIDRALGELSPEAAELLDAWCAQHPADTALSASIVATLQLAREATAGAVPAAVVPVPSWQRPVSAWRRRRPELLRLAACLALGASLGWAVRPRPLRPPAGPAVVAVAPANALVAEPAAPSRFWSVSARVEAARRSVSPVEPSESSRRLARPSLLKMPQTESKS